jgi:hypothetical protein
VKLIDAPVVKAITARSKKANFVSQVAEMVELYCGLSGRTGFNTFFTVYLLRMICFSANRARLSCTAHMVGTRTVSDWIFTATNAHPKSVPKLLWKVTRFDAARGIATLF